MADLLSHNWVLIVATAVLIFEFINGLATGKAILIYSTYEKSEDPLAYWISIIISGVGAAALAVIIGVKVFT